MTLVASAPAGAATLNLCDLLDKNSFFYQTACGGSIVSGNSFSQTIGAPGRVSNVVMTNVILPGVQPKAAERVAKMPMALGAVLKYDDVTFKRSGDDVDVDVYGALLGFSAERDRLTYGVMVPYDYMNFSNSEVDNVNQIGVVLYGKYKVVDNEKYAISLSANGSYVYADLDLKDGSDSINTFGAGVGATFTLNASEKVIPSLAVAYQYNHDDTDIEDYHLFKTGLNVGLLPSEKVAVNVFGIYNIDGTSYPDGISKDNYFDIGTEISYLISDAFNLTLGFKKVVDLRDFDSNMYYLGTVWRF
jgi:hypothetical protein